MLNSIDIEDVIKIAKEAGSAIMQIYSKDFEIEYKDDKSPLTEADKLSNEIICQKLKALFSNIPILSEENREIDYSKRKNWDYFWLIDPIDGTKEFIKKNGEFTVNIALIQNQKPILGVVYAPAIETLYYAKLNEGAFKQISNENPKKLPLKFENREFTIVASKSHKSKETEELIEKYRDTYPNLKLKSIGSSLKLCLVAEGLADVYPRLAPTKEWDTGASHIVVNEAKKRVINYENPKEELKYNKESILNPFFIVK